MIKGPTKRKGKTLGSSVVPIALGPNSSVANSASKSSSPSKSSSTSKVSSASKSAGTKDSERKSVRKSVARKSVAGKAIVHAPVSRKSAERKSFDREIPERETVERKTVERQVIEREERKPVEREERQVVERKTLSHKAKGSIEPKETFVPKATIEPKKPIELELEDSFEPDAPDYFDPQSVELLGGEFDVDFEPEDVQVFSDIDFAFESAEPESVESQGAESEDFESQGAEPDDLESEGAESEDFDFAQPEQNNPEPEISGLDDFMLEDFELGDFDGDFEPEDAEEPEDAIPRQARAALPLLGKHVQEEIYTIDTLVDLLPFPATDAHKYSRGRVFAYVGCRTYPGAAILAARASQRMGAGYTQVFTDAANVDLIRMSSPSLVVGPWIPTAHRLFASTPENPCAYLVGSGFDSSDSASAVLLKLVLEGAQAPVVVDGGALAHAVTETSRAVMKNRYDGGQVTVLTPHMGEAAKLARPFRSEFDTKEDPEYLACDLAAAYAAIVVLKGPQTFISDGSRVLAMDAGTPALAKAGTGDVLAGMIVALLAQGLDPLDACTLGTTLHAFAGIGAAQSLTEICVTAEDVIDNIPRAIKMLQEAKGDY